MTRPERRHPARVRVESREADRDVHLIHRHSCRRVALQARRPRRESTRAASARDLRRSNAARTPARSATALEVRHEPVEDWRRRRGKPVEHHRRRFLAGRTVTFKAGQRGPDRSSTTSARSPSRRRATIATQAQLPIGGSATAASMKRCQASSARAHSPKARRRVACARPRAADSEERRGRVRRRRHDVLDGRRVGQRGRWSCLPSAAVRPPAR
jgi:hypothetical protein